MSDTAVMKHSSHSKSVPAPALTANWREKNNIAESVVLDGFSVDVKELFDSLE